ncbi:MAG: 7,8-didemethyl-8-hydroxy-5-deazariboflavin synthase subunit CofH [Candidatus Lokiarchaeota archaeon]|nr:7,8-didemethyl-8-hydroxy-5-deazariboflavin synthase subunit CofH [Candidatus Lokiarchaeota archaeon]
MLEKALDRKRISPEDALKLFNIEDKYVDALFAVADYLRYQEKGDYVTYVLNRNINFTNICTVQCKFCAYHEKDFHSPEAFFLSTEQFMKKIREAKKIGATEICIQGGIAPNLEINFYKNLILNIKKEFPEIHIHGFSPFEIFMASKNSNLTIKEAIKILKEAGLDSIPGTAAEILVDAIRKVICENKLSVSDWVKVIKEAHHLSIPTTSTILYGHVESYQDRVEHLRIIREIQDETGGFTEFVPLAFINLNNSLNLKSSRNKGLDDLKLIAIARIFLDNIPNIQVSWVKLGVELAQKGLKCGANDFGGTLMEENISRRAGATNGQYLSENKIRKTIIDVDKIPIQRNTIYEILK